MKRFLIILLMLPLLVGCKEEDTILTERDKIVRYLTSRGLRAEDTVWDTIEENPPFYSSFGSYAYRHIVNYYDEGREDRPSIAWGDRVQIKFFNAYVFTGSEPQFSSIFWSNVPEVIAKVGGASTNTLEWSTEPLIIELGTTKILAGLEYALPGCHEADSVQVYMTSNLAYGKKPYGIVPQNSMIAWYMKIEKVIR
jgi:hypothetical protein